MSNSITTLVSLLDDFNFSSVNTTDTSTSIGAVLNFLKRAEAHLANTIATSPLPSPTAISQSPSTTAITQPPSPTAINQPAVAAPHTHSPMSSSGMTNTFPISTLVDYSENLIGAQLMKELKAEIKNMSFVPLSSHKNSPQISLHGDHRYGFNAASNGMIPTPFNKDSALHKVLVIVCTKLGLDYNSILVTMFRDKNVGLWWHKDGEKVIDNSVPISAQSEHQDVSS